jgi:nucleoside-diphosphate-sugar epimerase
MKIIITGATGFFGSYLTKALLGMGYEVIILKRSFSNINRISEILSSVHSYDIDKVPLELVFKEHNIDMIIHAATDYGKANNNISHVIDSNVVYPLRLLELLAEHGTVFINTDTFFNNNNSSQYSYLNSYSLSKKYFIELAQTYIARNQLCLINARLEHLYGPLDDESKFTMQIIKKLMSNEPQIELTLGNQERDFIYVDDAVSAYLHIIKNISDYSNKVIDFQVGTGTTCSIKQLVELSKEITGSSSELLFGSIPQRDNEILFSQADNSKLKALGWDSKVDLKSGISNIVNQMNTNK